MSFDAGPDVLDRLSRLDPKTKAEAVRLLEEKQRLERVQRARRNFLPFVEMVWPGFIYGAHHKIMAEAFDEVAAGLCNRLIINIAPRHRLTLDTPVATTEGWKTVSTVQTGDFVFSPDGSPVQVTGKSDVYYEDTYNVTTTDGQVIECDGDHLWSVRWGGPERPFVTMSTIDICNKANGESWIRHNNGPKLPPVAPIEYPERNLLIPPYVLGAWLGDGSSDSGTMAAHPADAPFIRARFERSGIETTTTKWDMTFGTKTLRVKLREIGVLNNKHIPEEYLTAHPLQRLALLQGLMDTDGTVSEQGKCCFGNSNKLLAEQVLELVHSFGLKARLTSRPSHYKGKPGQTAYRVMFKMANAASLPRKVARCRAIAGNFSRSITVEKTGRKAFVQCLEVANADGLFLAGKGYVVTHNTKSEFASFLLPAWFLGRFPDRKIIQASNTEALASGFGRKVRNMVSRDDKVSDIASADPYHEIFPDVTLAKDSQAASSWHTNKGGEYFAVGVNGRVTGKGGDIVIIDDPHDEQEAKQAAARPEIFDSVTDWFYSGPRQRLQPDGAIIIVATRWSKRDLCGQVLNKMVRASNDNTDQWKVIELPAILDEHQPTERSLWPAYWKLATLQATRSVLPASHWAAQYQQKPTSEEGAIIKREYWRRWAREGDSAPSPNLADVWRRNEPPACKFVLQSWDTSNTKNTRSDFSACVTFGVFESEDATTGKVVDNVILLNAWKARLSFPELKARVKQFFDEDAPDMLLIENKGSGMSMIQEIRAMGVPVQDFSYGRGTKKAPNDKIARANMVADIFASGYVWAPDTRWADEVITECADFPSGDHDDYVDACVQGLQTIRNGSLIATALDEDPWGEDVKPRRRGRMY